MYLSTISSSKPITEIFFHSTIQFYASVSEAESWMNDRKPLVSSEDYGKDEDTAETLIKKHEVTEKEIIGTKCICSVNPMLTCMV